jgi:hypothetical protein
MGILIMTTSGLPTWSSETKWHLGVGPMARHREYYWGGRWWLPPNSGCGEFCEFVFTRGSFKHQKCSNYALTNLLIGLCRFVWIIDPIFTHLNPHPKTPTMLLYPQSVASQETYPNLLSFRCFHLWTCSWVYQRVLGVRHNGPIYPT